MERTLKFKDVDLVVVGNYYSGESGYMYDNDMSGLPDTNASFEVENIYVTDSEIDIVSLFSNSDLETISYLILDNYEFE